MIVDIYASRRVVTGISGTDRVEYDFSYDPMAALDWSACGVRHSASACLTPTLRIEVPDAWSMTREEGITNLLAGDPCQYVGPASLLKLGRYGSSGTRIVSGIDPSAQTPDGAKVDAPSQSPLTFGATLP